MTAATTGTWQRGAAGAKFTVTVTGGASPVHYVALDLVGDGQPGAYFWTYDARVTGSTYVMPAPTRSGTFTYTVNVVDEMGCAASTVGTVTVAP